MEIPEELGKYRWSWWGQRAHDALGFNQLAELDFIVCCDWGQDIEKKWGKKRVISLERKEGKRTNFSNEDLKFVFNSDLEEKISKLLSRPLNCLMYRSVKSAEKAARRNKNINILSAPVALKNKFDDKVLFRKWLRKNGIKIVPGQILKPSQGSYTKIKNRWGEPFVLQFPVGSSGENTFLVKSASDFKKIIASRDLSTFIAFKYIKGFSLNINAVVGQKSVTLSPVSLQVIGSRLLTGKNFGFAGNDFSAAADLTSSIKNQIYSISEKTGRWMAGSGFRGMMGLDFICDGEDVYPVEINPRFQNSTSLLTLVELNNNKIPLVLKHIAEFIPMPAAEDFMFQPQGSQVIMHSLNKKSFRVKKSIKPGIYKAKEGTVDFLRNGFSINDCQGEDEFALCSAVPFPGCRLMPSAPLVKLHFPGRVLKKDRRGLKKPIELTVEKIYNKIVND